MAFDPKNLDSKTTPNRWRIVGKDMVDNDPSQLDKLDAGYREVLERSATFTSDEEMGVGNQPGIGSEPEPTPIFVSSVAITGAIETLDFAGTDGPTTVDLGVNVEPANADDKTVSWTSSDESLATVDSSGVVSAVADADGIVTIRAKANDVNGAEDTVEIAVVDTTVAP